MFIPFLIFFDILWIFGFFWILSAISLSFLITIGEYYTSEFGGLNIAFAQLISAGFVMLYFTTQGFGWMIENIGISLFLGIFLTAIGLTTYWYVVKIIKHAFCIVRIVTRYLTNRFR